MVHANEQYDYLGVGFGPSNLAFLVAMQEAGEQLNGKFIESKDRFEWHPGMMLDGARMQISYLKDLVTLRNPQSSYSFLSYLKAKGRLARFVNLSESRPSRLEYQDYLRWVADQFSNQIQYGVTVRGMSPNIAGDGTSIASFDVECEDGRGERFTHTATNLVVATGGQPNLLPDVIEPGDGVIHSSKFLLDFPRNYPNTGQSYRFGVVGAGQSAAETVSWILDKYPLAKVDWVISGFSLRPADESAFANEIFDSETVDFLRNLPSEKRTRLKSDLHNTNYSVVNDDLIQALYKTDYLDQVRGHKRLHIHNMARLTKAAQSGTFVNALIRACTGEEKEFRWDALVLATGYERSFEGEIFEGLKPFLKLDETRFPVVGRNHKLEMTLPVEGGVYVQGFAENTHGIGDTLLSLLPFRSDEIVSDIVNRQKLQRSTRDTGNHKFAVHVATTVYPPRRHVEQDVYRLHEVIFRFPFATIISGNNEPVVSHIPLILDMTKGKHGVLRGHIDRGNPQAQFLNGDQMLAIFHGPNSYIAPHIFTTDQLPTWNSISVHVKGTATLVTDHSILIDSLHSITEHAEPASGGYRLDKGDARIPKLIDYIAGFEINIESLEGKFKMSQDRIPVDRQLAFEEMRTRLRREQEAYFGSIMDQYMCVDEIEPAFLERQSSVLGFNCSCALEQVDATISLSGTGDPSLALDGFRMGNENSSVLTSDECD